MVICNRKALNDIINNRFKQKNVTLRKLLELRLTLSCDVRYKNDRDEYEHRDKHIEMNVDQQ